MTVGVLIVAEPDSQGGLHSGIGELIAAGRKLAGQREIALLAPTFDTDQDAQLALLDVDTVYRLTNRAAINDYDSGVYDVVTTIVTSLARQLDCATLLVAKSDVGSVVGPRVATRLGGAFAADCVDATLNQDGNVAVTRPVHGGNAMAVYEFQGDAPQVVSIRPGAFESASARTEGQARIENLTVADADIIANGATMLERVSEESEGIALESADIVVAGGRGLGGPEPFDQLRELCDVLGAALGASRAACDAGWIDHSHQVGLTGKKINPQTYITFGISGASQHMAGCSSVRNIVAINRDPSASIFAHARYGVAGDWAQVLPAFLAACAEFRGS